MVRYLEKSDPSGSTVLQFCCKLHTERYVSKKLGTLTSPGGSYPHKKNTLEGCGIFDMLFWTGGVHKLREAIFAIFNPPPLGRYYEILLDPLPSPLNLT